MPFKRDRSFYYPEGATERSDPDSDAFVYTYEPMTGVPHALGFHGRAQKPDWHHHFRSDEERERRIANFFAARRRLLAFKAEQRRQRVEAERGLEVGDVLCASWGWEQTNVDFYEVTGLVARRTIEYRPIAQTKRSTGFMCGKCRPNPGSYVGTSTYRARASEGAIRIRSHTYAMKTDPTAEHYWSSYA